MGIPVNDEIESRCKDSKMVHELGDRALILEGVVVVVVVVAQSVNKRFFRHIKSS